ncbi:lipoyltransferase 1, mitochondrial [Eurytemora carolleeae]|uniref:lipoyltransferase 1, mitochondrial n=1 Tax=Eurytemora carolleeae TaxID=1294199 RepID=UPI000C76E5AB|nr:lipoyltransferase 1, mitochondrial [Eurytemora carolleeae]|eukprot:XP_023338562.1 lipoyltransferase 1, mitochondrial-like [Eurytemora affinis]
MVISGTAAKIARNRAYHHCTILVDVQRDLLSKSLNNPFSSILKTNATPSIRSPIENISGASKVTTDEVETAIAQEFSTDTFILDAQDVVPEAALKAKAAELVSWGWIYGKSPKFEIDEIVPINGEKINISASIVGGYIQELNVGEHNNVLNDKILFKSESFLEIADSLRNDEREAVLHFHRIILNVA